MELTQEEIKGLANLRPLTRSTEIYEGMHIYTILKGRNGLNLLFDEVVLKQKLKIDGKLNRKIKAIGL